MKKLLLFLAVSVFGWGYALAQDGTKLEAEDAVYENCELAEGEQYSGGKALAMKERLYENCVVVAITNGQATFGWKKTINRATRIPCDHARLTYLSESTALHAYAKAIQTFNDLRDGLTEEQIRAL